MGLLAKATAYLKQKLAGNRRRVVDQSQILDAGYAAANDTDSGPPLEETLADDKAAIVYLNKHLPQAPPPPDIRTDLNNDPGMFDAIARGLILMAVANARGSARYPVQPTANDLEKWRMSARHCIGQGACDFVSSQVGGYLGIECKSKAEYIASWGTHAVAFRVPARGPDGGKASPHDTYIVDATWRQYAPKLKMGRPPNVVLQGSILEIAEFLAEDYSSFERAMPLIQFYIDFSSSGTTWISALRAKHPDIWTKPEAKPDAAKDKADPGAKKM